LASIFLASCGIYSFTGASIPADAETVSVAYFTTKATNTPATLNQTLTEGLKDLDGFSHIILILHFHLIRETKLLVKPYMDNHLHGVFSTRAPVHPNTIGISIVRLDKIENNILYIRDMDIIDGTPLLDIKPFVPQFDISKIEKIGWLDENVGKLPDTKDDERFLE
jgi:tRNA-Thr(GGU) m(6)t(6)A37 methyltransferase TsaA